MSVNKVILLGNLGRDPEVRYLDNNRVVANFPLATNEVYTDKKGNRIKQTEWHNIELWDSLAKIAENYLRKGYTIYLEGKIRTDKWTDNEGVNKSQKKIRGSNLTIVNKDIHRADNTSNTDDPGSKEFGDRMNDTFGEDNLLDE